MRLNEKIEKAIAELGFEEPTPVQEQLIPHMLSSIEDVVALAQTGTGKTAAFGLPLVHSLDTELKAVQALILCPTRELCLQIAGDLKSFARYMPGVGVSAVYGGANIVTQKKEIRNGAQIVAATPGRLLDLINRNYIDISGIGLLVLDEADIMLNMGFKDELDAILDAAPEKRQTILLSATMPRDVAAIAREYMRDPVEITVGTKNAGTSTVEHKFFVVRQKDKFLTLKRLLDYYPGIYGIVFCRTRTSTQKIADALMKEGYNADALHGDLSQVQREYVMRKFRERTLQVLVATDIAARGLDVDDLTHIVHYDLPDDLEVYTHRSGRTGRAGKTGISLSIVTPNETRKIQAIERSIKRPFFEQKVPKGRAICEQQLFSLISKVQNADVDTRLLSQYSSFIEEKLEHLSREEIIERFVSLEFNRFLQYYGNNEEIKSVKKGKARDHGRTYKGKRRASGSFIPLTINLGKRDQIRPPQLIGIINKLTKNRNIKMGKIDIGTNSTIVQIESPHAQHVRNSFKGFTYRGRQIKASDRD